MSQDIGPCKGRFTKWSFDTQVGKCKEFTFGGCEGNGNRCRKIIAGINRRPHSSLHTSVFRFSSQEECETVCVVYDEMSLSGDQTSFSRKAICKQESFTVHAHIDVMQPKCHHDCQFSSHFINSIIICELDMQRYQFLALNNFLQPMIEGPCDKSLKRWYYAPESGTCIPFIYTGCAGNRYYDQSSVLEYS